MTRFSFFRLLLFGIMRKQTRSLRRTFRPTCNVHRNAILSTQSYNQNHSFSPPPFLLSVPMCFSYPSSAMKIKYIQAKYTGVGRGNTIELVKQQQAQEKSTANSASANSSPSPSRLVQQPAAPAPSSSSPEKATTPNLGSSNGKNATTTAAAAVKDISSSVPLISPTSSSTSASASVKDISLSPSPATPSLEDTQRPKSGHRSRKSSGDVRPSEDVGFLLFLLLLLPTLLFGSLFFCRYSLFV